MSPSPPQKNTQSKHTHCFSLSKHSNTHTHTPASFVLTAQTQVTGRESRGETGMRSTYRKERRMKRRERRSALRRGNKRRMWYDNKPDSLSSPSSPSTQSGFEVRFYLVPPNAAFADPVLCNSLRHHTRSQLLTLTDPLSHVWTGGRNNSRSNNRSIDCFLPWPFSKPHQLKWGARDSHSLGSHFLTEGSTRGVCFCAVILLPSPRTCSHTSTAHPWLCLMSLLMSSLVGVATPSIHRRWWHKDGRMGWNWFLMVDPPLRRTSSQSPAAAAGTQRRYQPPPLKKKTNPDQKSTTRKTHQSLTGDLGSAGWTYTQKNS